MWYKDWALLSGADKDQFTRLVNIMLAKTFILRDRFDHREKIVTVDRDYRFIERNYELFREYLGVAGWDLVLDPNFGVAHINNRYGYNRRLLDKVTTYFLYVLRLIYEEEREKLSLRREVATTVGELAQKLGYLGLSDRKISDSVQAESLGLLKDINIIDRLDGSWSDPEARILIYPSIIFLVTNEKINFLYQRICEGDGAEDIVAPGCGERGLKY